MYRRLLATRRGSRALTLGALTLLDAPEGVLAYERVDGEDGRTALINFTGEPQSMAASGIIEVSSIGTGEGRPFTGTLAPDEAVILG